MKKKPVSEEMCPPRQRKYVGDGVEDEQPTTAIPRCTDYDLRRVYGTECTYVQDKPGNEPWTEKNRP